MRDPSLKNILIHTLICSTKLDHSYTLINFMAEDSLLEAFCEMQPTVNNNHLSKEKSLLIIKKINDNQMLGELVIASRNYNIINEALLKINKYSVFKKILEHRKDLEVHVKSRLSSVPNSSKFILD